MKIELKHPSLLKFSPACFEDILKSRTMGAFCGKVNKIADLISEVKEHLPNPYYTPTYTAKDLTFYKDGKLPPISGIKVANKFKGDIFELLVEFFIKMSPIDDRIDVYDYQLVTEDDTGVDGWGYNREGEKVTVQVKYRRWDWELDSTKEHLDNLRWTSYKKYDVKPEDIGRMLIVTAGKGINWRSLERYFSGKVRCISNDSSYGCLRGGGNSDLFSLQSIVNYNMMLWKSFKESIERKQNESKTRI